MQEAGTGETMHQLPRWLVVGGGWLGHPTHLTRWRFASVISRAPTWGQESEGWVVQRSLRRLGADEASATKQST